jgi:hypothetical protein
MSKGLGKTQRAILRYLATTGPADVPSIIAGVYGPSTGEGLYALAPTVRRALYGLDLAGLAARKGRLRTRTGSRAIIWEATPAGADLAGTWGAGGLAPGPGSHIRTSN